MGFSYFYPMNNQEPSIPILGKNETFAALHQKAHEYILEKQEELEYEYGFGQYDRYTLDENNHILSYFLDNELKLQIEYLVIGQYEKDLQQWTWQWVEQADLLNEGSDLEIIRNYGEFYGMEALHLDKWIADLGYAWAVTAIAAYLRRSLGIFRLQGDSHDRFILLKEIVA